MIGRKELPREKLNSENQKKLVMLEEESAGAADFQPLEDKPDEPRAPGTSKPPSAPRTNSPSKSVLPMPLTSKNLAEHNRQQTHFWSNPDKVSKLRKDQSNKLKAAAESLEVDMSVPVFGKMDQGSKGMLPEEKFWMDKGR